MATTHLERQNGILTAELVKALPNPTTQPVNDALFPPDLSDVMSTESDTDFWERTNP